MKVDCKQIKVMKNIVFFYLDNAYQNFNPGIIKWAFQIMKLAFYFMDQSIVVDVREFVYKYNTLFLIPILLYPALYPIFRSINLKKYHTIAECELEMTQYNIPNGHIGVATIILLLTINTSPIFGVAFFVIVFLVVSVSGKNNLSQIFISVALSSLCYFIWFFYPIYYMYLSIVLCIGGPMLSICLVRADAEYKVMCNQSKMLSAIGYMLFYCVMQFWYMYNIVPEGITLLIAFSLQFGLKFYENRLESHHKLLKPNAVIKQKQ